MEFLSKGIRACPTLQRNFNSGDAAMMNTGCGGYGYNKLLGGELVYGSSAIIPIAKLTQVQSSTGTIAFADAVQFDSYTKKPIEMFYISPPKGEYWGYPYDCWPDIHFRHHKQANIGFADGHVKPERLTVSQQGMFSTAENMTIYFVGWFGTSLEDAQTYFTLKK